MKCLITGNTKILLPRPGTCYQLGKSTAAVEAAEEEAEEEEVDDGSKWKDFLKVKINVMWQIWMKNLIFIFKA